MNQILFRYQCKLAYDKLKTIRATLANKAKALGLNPEQIQNINLVSSEYCANLLEHQAKIASEVAFSIAKSGADYIFTIQDNGSPWPQLSQQLATAELPLSVAENGMGLGLIRATLPDFKYQITPDRNRICFRLPGHKQRRQIVIVDDSASQLALLATFLEQDYQLALFSQASEALHWLANNHCDLVLTDLHMPDIDGLEFRRQVETIPHHQLLPFIFLSGDTLTDTLCAAARSGIDDFLAKPITQPYLLTVLKRVLERHNHLMTSFEARLEKQLTLQFSHTNTSSLAGPIQLLINQQPANGGDFVLQRQLRDGSQLIILGDQMGHGLIAKANGSACFGYINGLLHNPDLTPKQLLAILNSHLYQANEPTNLICLIMLHLSPDHNLTVYNAGMPSPIVVSKQYQDIEPGIGLLGLFESIEINMRETKLAPGDSLHCFSDGLSEAPRAESEQERLQAIAAKDRHQYLWQHPTGSASDDRSLISLICLHHEAGN